MSVNENFDSVIEGRSAATRVRNVGAAALPVVGPQSTVFAVWVDREKDKAGVVVAVATEVVNSGARLPALKLVTVPPVAQSPEATTICPEALIRTQRSGVTGPLKKSAGRICRNDIAPETPFGVPRNLFGV